LKARPSLREKLKSDYSLLQSSNLRVEVLPSCRSAVIGYGLLVIGYWLLVMGYWLLVIGYWLLVIGY
jgi:hypothetical protein